MTKVVNFSILNANRLSDCSSFSLIKNRLCSSLMVIGGKEDSGSIHWVE